jgi:hypothetical protein
MFFSDICGDFFNGMDYGSACVLGIGMYLCVVVVTCTGIIVSKISSKPNEDTPEEKENDQFQFIGGMKVGEPSADGRGSAPPELAEQQARAGSEAAPATPPL